MAISTVGQNGLTVPLVTSADASISGLTVGKGGGSVTHNTAVGNSALANGSLTGDYNTALGYNAGNALTSTATQNTAIGAYALNVTTSGSYNTGVGLNAMSSNTSGAYNTSIGTSALSLNTTASNNTAVGYQAGYTQSTNGQNTFMGYQSGYSTTSGAYNVAMGSGSLYSAAGSYNVAIGYNAGYSATSASNTFIGQGAGYYVTSGAKNTVLGNYNGNQGGLDIRTASNYIVLSDGDGNPRLYYDGSDWYLNQVSAGYYSAMRFKNSTGSNWQVGIQQNANSNFIVYNTSGVGVYVTWGATSWTGTSDERLKNITGEISDGLNKVEQLRAVEFTWKADDTNKDQVGLVAQDVQKVLPQAVSEDNEGNLGVRYTEVIPLLVAAIKELKAEFDAYKASHP